MHGHDVTIFPVYDGKHRTGPSAAFLGCLWSEKAFSAELPSGSFIDALRQAQAEGNLSLTAGHYLLLEFNDDIEEFGGLIFSVSQDGTITQQALTGQMPNVTHWPPKSV